MPLSPDKIASLVSSRILHDLINPMGAIANGLELLEMSAQFNGGNHNTAEIDLIKDSHNNANARIVFLRIAFGEGSSSASILQSEAENNAKNYFATQKITIDWRGTGSVPRSDIKRIFLVMMCMANVLAYGGVIKVVHQANGWKIGGSAAKMIEKDDLWHAVQSNDFGSTDIGAAQIHFALLALDLNSMGKKLTLEQTSDSITIQI